MDRSFISVTNASSEIKFKNIYKKRSVRVWKASHITKKINWLINLESILSNSHSQYISTSSPMAFKSPCVVSSTCNCGGDSCNTLRYGSEIQPIDRKPGITFPSIDLGLVPSPAEVDAAVTALQSLLQESFSVESMSKWLQPLMNSCDLSIFNSRGYQLLCKGFQWLLTDPTFKGLVISLCLDKDVWDAIKNNGIVDKLQGLSSSDGENRNSGSSKQGPDFVKAILNWVLQMSLTKIRELIQNFVFLLNNAFHFPGKEKLKPEKRNEIDEKIQSSFILSLVVLLIVVVARLQIA